MDVKPQASTRLQAQVTASASWQGTTVHNLLFAWMLNCGPVSQYLEHLQVHITASASRKALLCVYILQFAYPFVVTLVQLVKPLPID